MKSEIDTALLNVQSLLDIGQSVTISQRGIKIGTDIKSNAYKHRDGLMEALMSDRGLVSSPAKRFSFSNNGGEQLYEITIKKLTIEQAKQYGKWQYLEILFSNGIFKPLDMEYKIGAIDVKICEVQGHVCKFAGTKLINVDEESIPSWMGHVVS